ncbi:MAG TPA: hypothetical protein VG992_00370, partial [Candidatus Saccharimonadales bacterium]|nr:hypothetical protein [Candidatus Saccharimonadales bacterium]
GPLYWCHNGSSNFNTAANWNTNSDCTSGTAQVPSGGEDLVFLTTGLSADVTINNDIPSLSVNTITFQGTGTHNVTLTGNALTVAGGTITDNAASGGIMGIENSLTLGATTTVTSAASTNLMLGDSVSSGTLSGGTFNLSLVGTGAIDVYDVISGSGSITTSGAVDFNNANTFTGSLEVQSGTLDANNSVTALGTAAGSTKIDAGATVAFYLGNAHTFTIAEPFDITPGPSGHSLSVQTCNTSGCTPATEFDFTGDITLHGNTEIQLLGASSSFVARFIGDITGGTLSKSTGSTGALAFGAATSSSSSSSSSSKKTPKTPDTGFGLVTASPIVAALVSFAVTGSLVVMARHLKPIAK